MVLESSGKLSAWQAAGDTANNVLALVGTCTDLRGQAALQRYAIHTYARARLFHAREAAAWMSVWPKGSSRPRLTGCTSVRPRALGCASTYVLSCRALVRQSMMARVSSSNPSHWRFTYSLTHSPIHSLAHSPTHPLTPHSYPHPRRYRVLGCKSSASAATVADLAGAASPNIQPQLFAFTLCTPPLTHPPTHARTFTYTHTHPHRYRVLGNKSSASAATVADLAGATPPNGPPPLFTFTLCAPPHSMASLREGGGSIDKR